MLTRRFAQQQRLDWDEEQFSGHSLRRGGATSLFAAGVPAYLTKILGRWRSNCYEKYIETPLEMIRRAQKAMSTVRFGSVWPVAPDGWEVEGSDESEN